MVEQLFLRQVGENKDGGESDHYHSGEAGGHLNGVSAILGWIPGGNKAS